MHAAMNTSEIFLIAMLIIFAIPYAIWRLLKTEYYAPLVVVQIIGGIILGPGVLGHLFPDYYAFVFAKPVIGALNGIAWWAVMIFVWVAGIELDLAHHTFSRQQLDFIFVAIVVFFQLGFQQARPGVTPQGGFQQLLKRQDDALLAKLQGFVLVKVAGSGQRAYGQQRQREVARWPR